MRKLYVSSFMFLIILFNWFISLYITDYSNNSLTSGRGQISIEYRNIINEKLTPIELKIVEISNVHNVNMYQTNYVGDKKILFFHSNIEVDLLREKFENCRSKMWEINNHSIENVNNIGVGNRFYISTENTKIIENITSALSDYGDVNYIGPENIILKSIDYNVALFIVLSIILHLIISRLYSEKTIRDFSIYTFYNDSNFVSFIDSLRRELIVVKLFMILALIVNIINISMNVRISIITIFIVFLANECLYFSGFQKLYFIMKKNQVENSFVQIKDNILKLIIMMKIVFIIILMFLIQTLTTDIKEFDQILMTLNNWEQTIPVYRIAIGNLVEQTEVNLDKDLEYNKKAYKFYKELEENRQGFIIDSENYNRIEVVNDEIRYRYRYDMGEDEAISSPYGRRITISESYLEHNNITATSKTNSVKEQIIRDKNTLNILVPFSYKPLYSQIHSKYKDWFYFYRVTVPNYYNKALKLPKCTTAESELNINFIFYEDGSKFFTYNSSNGNYEGAIENPIAVILNDSLDLSVIGSIATHSMYMVDHDIEHAFLNLKEIISRTKLSEVRATRSVYIEYSEVLELLKVKIEAYRINILIVWIFSWLLCIFTFILFYEFYKKELCIKSYYCNGYKSKFYTLIVVDLLVLLGTIVGLYKKGVGALPMNIIPIISIIALDLLLGYYLHLSIKKNFYNEVD